MERRLAALAAAHGVATWYESADGHRVDVDPHTVIQVLGQLDVDATSSAAIDTALTTAKARVAALPPTIVITSGSARPMPQPGTLTLENGEVRPIDHEIPADVPLGWHRLTTDGRDITVVVVPRHLNRPPKTWGWMLQLYALRSDESWGMGDLGDLSAFVAWSGRETLAGLALVNPLHAIGPTRPVPSSPYSPSSRRFANPLYLRISDTDAYQSADADLRRAVDALRPVESDLIDYDAVWVAKQQALQLLFSRAEPVDLGADPDLATFATYCALAEEYGSDWRTWPEPLRTPASAVGAGRPDRIAFYAWLQRLCADQLAAANDAARDAGMPVGIVHDLAVGVDPGGADGWMLADVLASGVRVGAPPDAFNQLGQDWGLAAWRPDRLAETGYAAYRDLLRRVLSRAGGLRVDHVAGMWRLWWIPPGVGADGGTYVHYDPAAMLGILALEAHRAGAVVIGEDLGTVLPIVTRGLRGRHMLGSTVMWFARDGDGFINPRDWSKETFASISTHDLPTAYGFLAGEHVRVRAARHLLTTSEADELAAAVQDRKLLLDMLELPDDTADDDIVIAMHRALASSPCRQVGVSLYDVLAELRQPNLPGTTDEYPNWRIPLPASLTDIEEHQRVRAIAALMAAARPRR